MLGGPRNVGLTTDACSALTNSAAVAGNVALVDRGTCGFVTKVLNCQAAGAIGVVIANSTPGDPVPIAMGGSTGSDITIPALLVAKATGDTIRAQLAVPAAVAVSLASTNAGDTVATSSSRGPRLAASPSLLKPDIAAPGSSITNIQTGVTCTGVSSSTGCFVPNATGYLPDSQAVTLTGTSMASPHVAGTMALLRQLHPDWAVEQLKALAMNHALHDLYLGGNQAPPRFSPSRIGAGRIDAEKAALGSVIAYSADDAGAVSVSFGTEVVGSLTRTKTLRVVNTGAASQTFDLAIDTVRDAPGVTFSAPPTVTVGAGGSSELTVTLAAPDAWLLDHVLDPTTAATQSVTAPSSLAGVLIPRHYLTEEASYLTFSQAGNVKLRVPLYSAPRPASTMAAAGSISTSGPNPATLPLSGTDVCTGAYTPGSPSTCAAFAPADVASLVSPFELQVASPPNPSVPGYADLQYAGVAADATRIWFGVSTWRDWSTPSDVSFTVYVDNNSDGTWDRQIFTTNAGLLGRRFFGASSQGDQDTFIVSTFSPPSSFYNVLTTATPNYVNRLSAAASESVLYNTNVMFFGSLPSHLGLASTSTPFRYKIETCPGSTPLCQHYNGFHYDEALGPYSWTGGLQGLNFGGATLASDLAGDTLSVAWSTANLATNGSLGALLLHHHNRHGQRAQAVSVEGGASADLAVTTSLAPPSPGLGNTVTVTFAASNLGPSAAAGVVVAAELPVGMTYVSDNGGGAYTAATGAWTIGALASGGAASLVVTATLDTTQEVAAPALIMGTFPLDPNLANNEAMVTANAGELADLALAMTATAGPVTPGTPITYTLSVTNNGDGTAPALPAGLTNLGDDTAYSIKVAESFAPLPALDPTGYTASSGVYNPATGVWDIASLARGRTATLALTLSAPTMIGALTNQASASAATSDPEGGNNSAQAATAIVSPASISGRTKTVSPTTNLYPGALITYTIVLTNSSPFDQLDNPGNELVDVLPPHLVLLSASASTGTAVATLATNTASWNGPIPGSGGSVTITITASIAQDSEGQTVSNQATVHFDADGDGSNESSALTDDPSLPGADDATAFQVVAPIPALSPAGVAALALLIALLGLASFLWRRSA